MIKDLENAIGYRFQNITLLQNALTHSSYANERWHNSLLSNERLEFLGDSVLGMLVAEYLYHNFPNRPEGELTRQENGFFYGNDTVEITAVFENHQRGNAGNAVLLRHGRHLVDIQLADLDLPFSLFGNLGNGRRQHSAGAAPGRPEINQYRNLGFQNLALKIPCIQNYFCHNQLLLSI